MCAELYHSLVGEVATASYSYAMYTASDHMWKGKEWCEGMLERRSAVGIVDGCAAVDSDAEDKQLREKFFSMQLLLKGTKFESKLGKASVEADRVRIIDDIGAKSTELDRCVQGKVAAGGLLRAVGTQYCEQFMEKVRQGKVRKLQLDLKTCDEAFTEQVCELWKGFDASKLEELRVNSLSQQHAVFGSVSHSSMQYLALSHTAACSMCLSHTQQHAVFVSLTHQHAVFASLSYTAACSICLSLLHSSMQYLPLSHTAACSIWLSHSVVAVLCL